MVENNRRFIWRDEIKYIFSESKTNSDNGDNFSILKLVIQKIHYSFSLRSLSFLSSCPQYNNLTFGQRE